MRASQSYVDFMNGKISVGEYLAAYPAEVRHLVKIPARRPVELRRFTVADLPANPVAVTDIFQPAI